MPDASVHPRDVCRSSVLSENGLIKLYPIILVYILFYTPSVLNTDDA